MQAFAQIDTQVKQRHQAMHALFEQLAQVHSVDAETLQGIHAAHRQAVEASERFSISPLNVEAMRDLSIADRTFTAALEKLMTNAAGSASPPSAESMQRFADERGRLNNRIVFGRRAYNQTVMEYNAALVQFPGTIIARLFSFVPGQPWHNDDAPIERRQEPRVA